MTPERFIEQLKAGYSYAGGRPPRLKHLKGTVWILSTPGGYGSGCGPLGREYVPASHVMVDLAGEHCATGPDLERLARIPNTPEFSGRLTPNDVINFKVNLR